MSVEIMASRIWRKTEGTKRCRQCKVAAYCGESARGWAGKCIKQVVCPRMGIQWIGACLLERKVTAGRCEELG